MGDSGFEDFNFSVVDEATAPSLEDSGVLNARETSSLLEQVGADEDDRLGRGRHRNRKPTRVSILFHGFVTSRYGSCGLLRHDHKEMASQTDGSRFMAAALS
jgi:hypothetical protein